MGPSAASPARQSLLSASGLGLRVWLRTGAQADPAEGQLWTGEYGFCGQGRLRRGRAEQSKGFLGVETQVHAADYLDWVGDRTGIQLEGVLSPVHP